MATKTETKATKVAFGLDRNLAAALSYVFLWGSGLVLLLTEKKDKFVRFHAMQAFVFFGGLHLIVIASLGFLFPIVFIVGLIGWLMGIFKANNGEEFELPVAGKLARKQLAKMK